jgi:hypothetical protein
MRLNLLWQGFKNKKFNRKVREALRERTQSTLSKTKHFFFATFAQTFAIFAVKGFILY